MNKKKMTEKNSHIHLKTKFYGQKQKMSNEKKKKTNYKKPHFNI